MVFGDQEEMGLGIRVHTGLTVKAGGTIRDSEGRVDEKGIWGKTAKWCAYYRTFGKIHRGVAIFPDPANFRPSWWHVRDYGLIVANPFGQNAFTKGEKSRVVVKKGETLYSIARRNGVAVEDIARWNGLKPPYTIYPGQRLALGQGGGRSGGRQPVAGHGT